MTQALTQPFSYLYFKLFLAQCNPEVKYQDPSPAISWSSLPPLVFLSSFTFPSQCWDFNYFSSNRKGCWGSKPTTASLYTSFAKLWWEQFSKPFQSSRANTKRQFGPVGFGDFFNKGGNLCIWATDGNSKPRATHRFWSVSKFDAQLKTTHWNDSIFRNQRVSQEIQVPSKYLQLKNEKASVENVGWLCFLLVLSVYSVNFRWKAKHKSFNEEVQNQTLIEVIFHYCFYQFNHYKHVFAFSLTF